MKVEELHVHHGLVHAVKGITLEVPEGSMVALLGANGAGKTTIMRTISGLLTPTSGEVRFSGRVINKVPAEDRPRLGLLHVPEGRGVFHQLTVDQVLQLGGHLQPNRRKYNEDLEQLFVTFPILKQKRHQPAGSLSGGQQQILSIARSILARPRLLLVDEISFGLAPVVVKELTAFLQRLNREGLTVLLVEQNVGLALQMAHFAYVLETGVIRLSGSPAELANRSEVVKACLGGH